MITVPSKYPFGQECRDRDMNGLGLHLVSSQSVNVPVQLMPSWKVVFTRSKPPIPHVFSWAWAIAIISKKLNDHVQSRVLDGSSILT